MNESAPAQTLAEGQSVCRVRLDAFDGPLDLLLSLIKEQQLDIATVPLATVAEQYLEYVRMMDALDVEIAAEYLVIAATLVFLKSRALLPPIPQEFADEIGDSPEEVEERLRRRLIAYSKYRELGEELRERQGEAASFFYRDSGDPAGDVAQRYEIDPQRLKRAFIAMLAQAHPEKRSIARERVSLIASMDYIVRRIKESGEVTFSALCKELGMTREVIIVTFLAMLELIRRHRVGFEQPALFDDIRLFYKSRIVEESVLRLQRPIEALLFVASEALSIPRLAKLLRAEERDIALALQQIEAEYSERGIVLREIAGGYRFATSPLSRDIVEAYLLPPKTTLSAPALEALAIVAHMQPVTRSEIEAIRGVNSDSVVSTLLDRGFIAEAGRKDVVGRPMQYRTTPLFLESFGLRTLDDLPALELEPGQPLELALAATPGAEEE